MTIDIFRQCISKKMFCSHYRFKPQPRGVGKKLRWYFRLIITEYFQQTSVLGTHILNKAWKVCIGHLYFFITVDYQLTILLIVTFNLSDLGYSSNHLRHKGREWVVKVWYFCMPWREDRPSPYHLVNVSWFYMYMGCVKQRSIT